MPGADPFSPTTQLAYDPAAARAGVIPGAKKVTMPKAWRPPQLAQSQMTQGSLMPRVGAGQSIPPANKGVERKRPMWTPQQLGMPAMSPWQHFGAGQSDDGYVPDDIPEGNTPYLPPPAAPPPLPLPPRPVPDVQQPGYPGAQPMPPPPEAAPPPDDSAAPPSAPAPRPRAAPPAPARSAPAPRAAAPAPGGGGAPSGGGGAAQTPDHQAFLQNTTPIALKYQQMYGIPANVLLAINVSESNWGNAPGNELFGIKAHAGTSSQSMGTWEQEGGQHVNQNADFSTYDSADAAYQDFFDLISKSPIYKDAWTQYQQDGDWRALLAGINKAGYATDPKWHSNIESIQASLPDTGDTKPYAGASDTRNGITMAPNQRDFEQQAGLDPADAYTACGPAAAEAFAQTYGRYPSPVEAMQLARQVGWTPNSGMAGVSSESALLQKMGVDTQTSQGVDWNRVQQSVAGGDPVILDTPYHYFYVSDYDPNSGMYYVGQSGSAFRGGGEWMSPDQIAQFGRGSVRAAIYVASGTSKPQGGGGIPGVDFTAGPDAGVGAGQSDDGGDGGGLTYYSGYTDPSGGTVDLPPPSATTVSRAADLGWAGPDYTPAAQGQRAAAQQASDAYTVGQADIQDESQFLSKQQAGPPPPLAAKPAGPTPRPDAPVRVPLQDSSQTRQSLPRSAVSTGPPPATPQAPDQAPQDQPSATPDTTPTRDDWPTSPISPQVVRPGPPVTPTTVPPTAPLTAPPSMQPPVEEKPPLPDAIQAAQAAGGAVVQAIPQAVGDVLDPTGLGRQILPAAAAGAPAAAGAVAQAVGDVVDPTGLTRQELSTVAPVAQKVLSAAGTAAQTPSRITMGSVPAGPQSPFYTGKPEEAINPLQHPGEAIARAQAREEAKPGQAALAEFGLDPLNAGGEVLGTAAKAVGLAGLVGFGLSKINPITRIAEAVGPVEEGGKIIPGLTRLMTPEEVRAEIAFRHGIPNAADEGVQATEGIFRTVEPAPRTALPTDVSAEGLPLGGELPPGTQPPAPPGTPQLPSGTDRALAVPEETSLAKPPTLEEYVRQQQQALAKQGVGREIAQDGTVTHVLTRRQGLAIPDDGSRLRITDVTQIPDEVLPKIVVPDYDSMRMQQAKDPVVQTIRRFMRNSPARGEIQLSPAVKAAYPDGARVVEQQYNAARRAAAGVPKATDPGVAQLYPGGWLQYHIDNVRGALTDRLASVETGSTVMQLRDMAISRALQTDPLKEGDAANNAYKLARLSAGASGQASVWTDAFIKSTLNQHGITAGAGVESLEAYMLAVDNVQRTVTQDIVRNFHSPDEVRAEVMKVMQDVLERDHPNVKLSDVLEAATQRYREMQPEVVSAGRTTPLESGPIIGTDSHAALESLDAILADAEEKFGGKSVPMPSDPYPGAHLAETTPPTSMQARYAAVHRDITAANNMLIKEAERVGLLKPGTAQRVIDAHDTWTHLRTADDDVAHWTERIGGARSPSGELASGAGVGREHGTEQLSLTTLDDMLGRGSRMFDQFNRQEVANTLQRYARTDPTGFGQIMRKLSYGEQQALEHGSPKLNPGKSIVTMFDRGEQVAYEMPSSLAGALNGTTKWQTGWLENIASKASRIQSGIYTTYSPIFWFNNYARHEQTAWHNLPALLEAGKRGGPGGITTADRMLAQNVIGSLMDSALTGPRGAALRKTLETMDPKILEEKGLGMAMSSALEKSDPRRALEAAGGQMHAMTEINPAVDRLYKPSTKGFGLADESSAASKVGRFVLGGPGTGRAPLLSAWMDVSRAVAETTEMATRVNMFKVARAFKTADELASPTSLKEAAYLARSATIDYSKGGNAIKAFNSLFPFLNSRVQATVNPLVAMKTDPATFAVNAAVGSLATFGLYALNRGMFSDEYDRISDSEKNNNFIIPLGRYQDDTGQWHMMRINVRKDETAMMLSNPIEHLMNDIFHMTYNGQPLDISQRNNQGEFPMWLQELMDASGLQTALPGRSTTMFSGLGDVGNTLDSRLSGMALDIPGVSAIVENATQTDQYGNPRVPESQRGLPPQFQWGGTYHPASAVLSNIISGIGGKVGQNWVPQPASVSALYQQLPIVGGLMGGLDFAAERLNLPLQTQNADQQNPPAGATTLQQAEAQYRLNQQNGGAGEPKWAQVLGMAGTLFKTSNSAQTLRARLNDAPPDVRDKIQASLDAADAYDQWRQTDYYPQRDNILNDPDLTAQAKISQLQKLSEDRKATYDTIYSQHPGAVTDYNERQKLIAQIPGIPLDASVLNSSADLPKGVDQAQLLSEYRNPLGPDGTPIDMSQLTPEQRSLAQYRVVEKYANQYGVATSVIQDQIKAQMGGKELPVVGVPNAAVEDWVNQYISPPNDPADPWNPDGITNASKYRTAQDTEVGLLSQQYGVPEQTIRDRINLRLQSPEEQSAEAASMNDAFDLASTVDNPKNFPKYIQKVVAPNGKLYSVPYRDPTTGQATGPEDWKRLDLQIGYDQAQRKPRQPESEQQKDLRAAQMYGQLYRLQGLHGDPNDPQSAAKYADYQRWKGSYSLLTDKEYQDVQNGTTQRYRDLDPSQVAEANRRDYVIQQMKLTPNSPYNHTLSPAAWEALPQAERDRITQLHRDARAYAHQAVQDWQKVLQYNDLTGKVDEVPDPSIFNVPGVPDPSADAGVSDGQAAA